MSSTTTTTKKSSREKINDCLNLFFTASLEFSTVYPTLHQNNLRDVTSDKILNYLLTEDEENDPVELCSYLYSPFGNAGHNAVVGFPFPRDMSVHGPMNLLHWACFFGLSYKLIQTIHQHNPDACEMRRPSQSGTVAGRLPLDLVLIALHGKNADTVNMNFDTVKLLVDAYPESILQQSFKVSPTTAAERIFLKFPPRLSLDLLQKYLSQDLIKTISLSGEIGWCLPRDHQADDPLPVRIIEAVRDIHGLESMTIRATYYSSCHFSYMIHRKTIVVNVGYRNLGYVVREILKVSGLPLTTILIEGGSPFLIALLNSSSTRDPPTLDEANAFDIRGDIPPNMQYDPHHPPDLDLSSVERLTITSTTRNSSFMQALLEGVERSFPNLKILHLNGRDRRGEITLSDSNDAYASLSRLADRLEEIEIRCIPFRAAPLLDLLEASRLLTKVTFILTRGCMMESTNFERLTQLLSGNSTITHLRLHYKGQEGEGTTINNPQLGSLLRALTTNTTLLDLTTDFVFTETTKKSLVDVVRKKRNTTLQRFVCSNDSSLQRKMNYWCSLNQIEPHLHAEDVDLAEGIRILEPYSLEDKTQMVFEPSLYYLWKDDVQWVFALLRSRVALWFPSS